MDKISRIDEFLKLMAGAFKKGYGIHFGNVYDNLIFLGVEKRNVDISSNFDKWLTRFENTPNINVSVNDYNKYFCFFDNSNYPRFGCYNMIKLYIPLDKEHIENGANIIFDYLAKENIPHNSKIAKRVRFDDVVVRVSGIENARKIIEFVNSSEYLREGHLQSSPFAVSDGIVSMAWDGNLSYNEVLSHWISQYIEWEKENNNLNNVNYSRFYAFVDEKQKMLFERGRGLTNFVSQTEIDGFFKESFDGIIDMQLLNYYCVTKMILTALNPNSNENDFYRNVLMVTDESYQNYKIDEIHNMRVGSKEVKTDNKIYTEIQKNVILCAFKTMVSRYGFVYTKEAFENFMIDGSYARITRYNGARDMLRNNGITKEILQAVSIDWNDKNNLIENTLNLAMEDTLDKFDFYQVSTAISALFRDNDFSYITNRNGYREQLKNLFQSNDIYFHIMDILYRNGYDDIEKSVYNNGEFVWEMDMEKISLLYLELYNRKTDGRMR